MHVFAPSSEDEMIAEFLGQEYGSVSRYRSLIDAALASEALPATIITEADLADAQANADRARLFRRYRGYGQREPSYFTGFPAGEVNWQWVELSREELLETRFVRYWAGIWESTRDPRELAARIVDLRVPEWAMTDGTVDRMLTLAAKVRAGLLLPPPILVSADDGATRVVMEGNSRLTAYALAAPYLPATIAALLGTSPLVANWDEW